jgi:hypothetical protein
MGACNRTVLDSVQILIMADNGTMAREQGCSQHGDLSNKGRVCEINLRRATRARIDLCLGLVDGMGGLTWWHNEVQVDPE